jgi:hypothetical protein
MILSSYPTFAMDDEIDSTSNDTLNTQKFNKIELNRDNFENNRHNGFLSFTYGSDLKESNSKSSSQSSIENYVFYPNYDFSITSFEETENKIVDLTSQNKTIINGFLGDEEDNSWNNEIVRLYIDDVNILNTTTDSDGNYEFTLEYDNSDIGRYYYDVIYDGREPIGNLPPTRPPRNLTNGYIDVIDTIFVSTIQSSENNQGQTGGALYYNQSYTYKVTLNFSDGTPFNPTSFSFVNDQNVTQSTDSLEFNITEVYNINGDPFNASIDKTSELLMSNTQITSNEIIIESYAGSQDVSNIDIDVSFNISGVEDFASHLTFLNAEQIITQMHTIIIDISYSVDFTIEGSLITSINQNTRTFYRDQNFTINGTLAHPEINSSIFEGKRIIANVTYALVNSGNSFNVFDGVIDNEGKFSFLVFLDSAVYTSVIDDFTIIVILDPDNLDGSLGLTLAQRTKERTINFRADISSIIIDPTPKIDNSNTVYVYVTDDFWVNGTIYYDTNSPVNDVELIAHIVGVGVDDVLINTAVSASDGTFSFRIHNSILSQLDETQSTFAVRISVLPLIGDNLVFYNPDDVSNTTNNFEFSKSVSITSLINFDNIEVVNNGDVWYFNVTWANILSNLDSNYSVTIMDNVGRAPLGMKILINETIFKESHVINQTTGETSTNIAFLSSSIDEILITDDSILTYFFLLNSFTTGFDNPIFLNGENIRFTYTIHILENNDELIESKAENVYTFGPKDTPPQLFLGSNNSTEDGSLNNVTVSVEKASFTRSDNIRAVYIYWRFSDNNFVGNQLDASFTSAFNKSEMTSFDNNVTFSFTIQERGIGDHGRWVEYYFEIEDYAGRGLKQDGSIADAGEYPTYDQNFFITTTYDSNLFYFRMGDLEAPDLNGLSIYDPDALQEHIFICVDLEPCGQFGIIGSWAPTANNTVRIELRNLNDMTGIDFVNITIRIRELDPDTLDPISPWSEVNVTMILDNGVYYFILAESYFENFYHQIDFQFLVVDVIGNQEYSGFLGEKPELESMMVKFTLFDETDPPNFGGEPINDANNIAENIFVCVDSEACVQLNGNWGIIHNNTFSSTVRIEVRNLNDTSGIAFVELVVSVRTLNENLSPISGWSNTTYLMIFDNGVFYLVLDSSYIGYYLELDFQIKVADNPLNEDETQPFRNYSSLVQFMQRFTLEDTHPPILDGFEISNSDALAENIFVCVDSEGCEMLLDTNLWSVELDSDVRIEIRNLFDINGIQFVEITIRYRFLNVITLEPIGDWNTETFIMSFSGGGIYFINLNSTLFNQNLFDYYIQLDFNFNVVDNIGNSDVSGFLRELNATLITYLDNFIVFDTTPPNFGGNTVDDANNIVENVFVCIDSGDCVQLDENWGIIHNNTFSSTVRIEVRNLNDTSGIGFVELVVSVRTLDENLLPLGGWTNTTYLMIFDNGVFYLVLDSSYIGYYLELDFQIKFEDLPGNGDETQPFRKYPTLTSLLDRFTFVDSHAPVIGTSELSKPDAMDENILFCVIGGTCVSDPNDWSATLNGNFRIEIHNLNDLSDIGLVNMTIKVTVLDPEFLTPINIYFINVTMTQVGAIFRFDLDPSLFDYYLLLDFRFTVFDNIGNNITTSFLSELSFFSEYLQQLTIIDGTEPSSDPIQVLDEFNQELDNLGDDLLLVNPIDNVTISVQVFDDGIGLKNATIYYSFYLDIDRTLLFGEGSFSMNLAGDSDLFVFEIPSDLFGKNYGYFFFWIVIYDLAGNEVTINNNPEMTNNVKLFMKDQTPPSGDFEISGVFTEDVNRFEDNVYEVWLNETITINGTASDSDGIGLKEIILFYTIFDEFGNILSEGQLTLNGTDFENAPTNIDFIFELDRLLFNKINNTIQFYIQIIDHHDNIFELNNDIDETNNIRFELKDGITVDKTIITQSINLKTKSQESDEVDDLKNPTINRPKTNFDTNSYEVFYYENITLSGELIDVYSIGLTSVMLIYYIYNALDELIDTFVIEFDLNNNLFGLLSISYIFNYTIPSEHVAQGIGGKIEFIVVYEGQQGNIVTLNDDPNPDNNIKFLISDYVPPEVVNIIYENQSELSLTSVDPERDFTNTDEQVYQVNTNEVIRIILEATDDVFGTGSGLLNATIYITYIDVNGQSYATRTITQFFNDGTSVIFIIPNGPYQHNATIMFYIEIYDLVGNLAIFNENENPDDNIKFLLINPALLPPVRDPDDEGSGRFDNSNSVLIIMGFMIGVAGLVIFYQRRNIVDYFQRRQRGRLIRGTMASRIDLIKQLGLNGDYKRAVLNIWKATQTLGSEGLQAPQKYNQTVRDYLKTLERVSSIDRDVLETLGHSFEAAKYGRDPITVDQFDKCLQALNVAIDTVIATGAQFKLDEEDDWAELNA